MMDVHILKDPVTDFLEVPPKRKGFKKIVVDIFDQGGSNWIQKNNLKIWNLAQWSIGLNIFVLS